MSVIASKKCPLLLLSLLCITTPDCECQAILLLLEIVFLLDLVLQQQKVCFLAHLYPDPWILFIQSMRKCFPVLDL